MLWTRTGGFDDVFVCGCAGRPQIKHEPQLAPIVSGSNMRRAPWISVAPCVPASCYHRIIGEKLFGPGASTTSRVARFCGEQTYIRICVLHPEEEIEGYVHRVGRRGVRHPSCLLVFASTCHLIICVHLRRARGSQSKSVCFFS